ncbi:MAG: TorF family putative porin [Gammaproteobacteria bacterium]|nr:TorF family putative porin [Gammaproteobacteria bacterium]MBU1645578.1 TorF family putative porin [Gammaproteobacteria bacterium]MBU1973620.1 TorF family putative porin [Gammaproteobacteria bacterium]
MDRKFAAILAAAACLSPLAASAQNVAPASPHTVTGNFTLATDYRFRGISQTFKLPTVQGGIDYSHDSGFYLGTWASNVSGLQYTNGASLEMDFYGGFKFAAAKDWTFDLGVLHYNYPGAFWNNTAPSTGTTKFNNTEVYAAVGYKWASLKYSHTVTDLFGIRSEVFAPAVGGLAQNCGVDSSNTAYTPANAPYGCFDRSGSSKGSGYLDFTANVPLSDKATLVAHVGRQTVKNYGRLTYSDWKLGINYDLGSSWILGGAYVDTNAKESFYRFANAVPAGGVTPENVKDVSNGTVVVSISKSF